jgi:predicted nucleotidyltransferase
MLLKSNVTDEAKQIIQQKLIDTARNNNVRILFAAESGSRAWGFPSTNSDYDVRFVYARSKNEYLSVKQYRDVIETDIIDDISLGVPLDLNGWDIRKALQLAVKSNAVLIEWLQSPIKYSADSGVITDLLKFTKEISDIETIKDHYYKVAMNAWQQIQENADEVKVKLYCYALRPALTLQWVRQFNDVPPMDMKSLCDKLIKDDDLYREISDLITLKSTAQENDLIMHYSLIDSFIELALNNQTDGCKEKTGEEKILQADKFFRKIIEC